MKKLVLFSCLLCCLTCPVWAEGDDYGPGRIFLREGAGAPVPAAWAELLWPWLTMPRLGIGIRLDYRKWICMFIKPGCSMAFCPMI